MSANKPQTPPQPEAAEEEKKAKKPKGCRRMTLLIGFFLYF
jgi:hypothetical protein